MSTTTDPPRSPHARPSDPVVAGLQSVAVLLVLAGAGAIGGIVWARLWDAPTGRVRSGQWFTDETGLRADFSGTALYVVVALVAGLVCGVLVGLLLARWEVLTLVMLLLAAGLAGWLMWRIGMAQSPPDPQVLAKDAADGTRLPGHLEVTGRPPFVAFPLGAVLGYAVLLISVPKRGSRDETTGPADEDLPPTGWDAPGPSSLPAFPPPPPG